MRVAAIYDIHGNLPALEAVLEEIDSIEADHIVVGGDVIPGPFPAECVSMLLGLETPVTFVAGNGERETLALLSGNEVSIPERYIESMNWVGRQLSEQQVQKLDEWNTSVQLGIPNLGEVLFCHATPTSDSDIFTIKTPSDRLASAFDSVAAAVVICGHTHMQFDRQVGDIRVVNAGSVGMPFGQTGADWILLGSEIEFRKTNYDLHNACERIRASAYPLADEFASKNVLNVPAAATMLDIFERAAMR